jgi:hypothetical protein
MSNNAAFQRALHSLTHPLSVSAILLLLINALILQRWWPSWWSGKIGDAAWLAFAPLLVGAGLALVAPRRLAHQPDVVGRAAIVITGAGFALIKTVPALNAAIVDLASGLGWPLKLRLDSTDLLALPGLLAAWWLWHRLPVRRPPSARQWAALGLAAVAVVADSPAPQQKGVVCLTITQEGVIYAITETHNYAYIGSGDVRTAYRTDDGGLTWNEDESFATDKPTCYPSGWPQTDPADANVQFYYVAEKGVYQSEDEGTTLQLEIEMRDVAYGTLTDKATGNLLIAAGRSGVLVRTQEGEWKTSLAVEAP